MGVHSGKFAVVGGISTAEGWNINVLQEAQASITSNTQQGTARTAGVNDWNGSFTQKGGKPTYMPGDTFSFSGYTAPDDDVLGEDGAVYAGPAIVDQVQITWNWETSAPLMMVTQFSGNGEVSESSDLLEDATDPDLPTPVGLRWTLGADEESGSADDLCISQAQLTIVAANQAYVNSCTNNWRMRKAGPIDWNATLTLHNDSGLANPFAVGDDQEFWAYVTNSTYWILKWGHVLGFNGITANRSGQIVGMTVNLAMNGWNSVIGQIRLPGEGSDWWPVSA